MIASLLEMYGDPAERIIAATALELGVPLISADKEIQRWAEHAHKRCP